MMSRLPSRLRNAQLAPLILTAGAGWSTRFATAAAQFAAIRLLTDRLNADGYGAFAVISGLLAWFMLADLGFGSAIQNHISHARVDGMEWHSVVRKVTLRLAVALIGLWLLTVIVASWIGPYLLAGYTTISRPDAAIAFAVFGILLSTTGALSIALKVQFAEHRGYVAHLVTGLGALAGLALLAGVLRLPIGHMLVWSIVAYYLPGVLFSLSLLLWIMRKAPRDDTASGMPDVLVRQARVFLLFAALSAMILNVDYIILSRTVMSGELLVYAIVSKAYALIFVLYNSILQAYWPVSAEAMRRGDALVVQRSIRRCITIGAMIVLGGTAALIVGIDRIVLLLAPSQHPVVPVSLIVIFASYWLVRVWTDVFGVIIMSSGQVGYLCKIVPIQAAVSVPSAYIGARWFGVAGLIGGLSIGYLATVAWMMPRHINHHLKTLSGAPA